jgi:hypothetical protein
MLGFFLASAPAVAQPAPEPTPVVHTMEANLRFRRLSVPRSFVDAWFYDKDDGSPYERPKIGANAFGAEFVMRSRPTHWLFYFEYLKNTTGEGYWDDVENGEPIDHDDGDWVRPDGVGAFVLGATIQNELRLTPDGATVGGAFLFGGGVGLVFVGGDLLTWHDGTDPDIAEPSCLPKSDSWKRKDACAEDGDKRIPRLLPMIDLSLSAQIDYRDKAQLRIDVGIHDLLFFGLAAGAAF